MKTYNIRVRADYTGYYKVEAESLDDAEAMAQQCLFDEIRESLNLSKSATSNAINLLMNNKQIDYITRPGERKRYFKNTIASWRTSMEDAFEKLTVGADIFEEVLKQRPAETPEFNHSLREIIDFMRFVNEEMPKLYKKWQEERN